MALSDPTILAASDPVTTAPSLRARLAVAVGAGFAAAVVCAVKIRPTGYATDFKWFWVAGRALLDGQSPYAMIHAGIVHGFPFDQGFVYPLPAAILAMPFALLPVYGGSLAFVFLTTAVLAYALTRDGWWRLPSLMSMPMLWAVSSGQWSPLVTAAALSPGFAWAAAVKPTLGAAVWLRRPTWRFFVIAAACVVLSLVVDPRWPVDWWRTTRQTPAGFYHVPVLVPGGFVLLLAALRWRAPEGRLLLGMALVPQTMVMYDQLPLVLVARNRMQAIVVSLWSYLMIPGVFLAQHLTTATSKLDSLRVFSHLVLWLYYVPALVWVLRRPSERSSGEGLVSP